MSVVNTSPIFAPAGVWNVGDGDTDKPEQFLKVQLANVGGWIPGISIIAGIASIIIGNKQQGPVRKVLFVRGLMQTFQLGLLLAPVDIACSSIRSYREWKSPHIEKKVV